MAAWDYSFATWKIQDLDSCKITSHGYILRSMDVETCKFPPLYRTPKPKEQAHLRASYYWILEALRSENFNALWEAGTYLQKIQAWGLLDQLIRFPLPNHSLCLHQYLLNEGLYSKMLDLYQPLVHKISPQADIFYNESISWAHRYLGEFSDAIILLEKLQDQAKQDNNILYLLKALGGLTYCYTCNGNYYRAKQCGQDLKRLIKANKNISSEIDEEFGRSYSYLGYMSGILGENKQALKYLEKGKVIAQAHRDEHTQQEIERWIPVVHMRHKHKIPFIEDLEAKYHQAKHNQNIRRYAIIALDLGIAYCYKGKVKQALPYLEESQVLLTKIRSTDGLCLATLSLGFIFFHLLEFQKAESHLQRCFQLSQQHHFLPHQSLSCAILSYTYSVQSLSYLALREAKKSWAIAQKVDIGLLKGCAQAALGLAFLSERNILQGLYHLSISLYLLPPWKSKDGLLLCIIIFKVIGRLIYSIFTQRNFRNSPSNELEIQKKQLTKSIRKP